ncbi:hypothetical protein TTHERM_00808040 (macronuclear) [Tetrahymena thermophila SB210]|uniref:Uncharacterized protein n=1 Tax=Tetrahymena thermophila (strain SB210) TaxID=312017 RepID=Q233R9_TETTS|nr:hypothetical protein TTHERM_00808040 [Tetrahymena thermophila SB210]EAR91760.1 hypothetical protein TTHERM_00808040 [Tetrahymena thermophila SB210]|eukprot:XP_001012005.1 hypothetical protein TTHERM_00808040 [Tetrahymena thermophila SB210]
MNKNNGIKMQKKVCFVSFQKYFMSLSYFECFLSTSSESMKLNIFELNQKFK